MLKHIQNIMMKYLYITFLLLCSLVTYCQTIVLDNPPTNVIYTTMVNDANNLYALNDEGQLVIWDLKTLKKVYEQHDTSPKYTAITKDRNGVVCLATDQGVVSKLKDYNGNTELIYKPEVGSSDIYFVFFNSKNEMYLVKDFGIYSVTKDRVYVHFDTPPRKLFFKVPKVAFIDSKDYIWTSYYVNGHGCVRNIFDTKNNKILDETIELGTTDYGFIESFTEDSSGNVYIFENIRYPGKYSQIHKVTPDLKKTKIYDSNHDFNGRQVLYKERIISIQVSAWNRTDEKLYFASSDGFYKAAVSVNNKLINVERLFSPVIITKRGNLDVGVQIPIKQIAFTNDNRLLFLTATNGIGVHDGKELVMLE